ncbi:hypothetical protein HGM15179_003618 [Zosterops borbonicus]|uniref:RING-type domain-containing protein n=1 Tax=Zosterops borbonicus TaxID=364589 RepID=A0A8K1LRW3_9PASS|nr:hypothetical protein HGM15179_003618 [Zosterops borbonicus]
MAEGGQEPPAARPVRVCRICVDFLQSPAAVEPCGHVFCHACIQPQAAPEAAATCPVCQGPIRAIRLLPRQDTGPGPAPRRRRRLHPFVLRWRQRQQREAQEEAAPGGGRRRRLSDGDRAPSPVPRQRPRRELDDLERNGLGRRPPTGHAALAAGDNQHRPPVIGFDGQILWPV